jgi:hypothetical protein
MIVHSEKGLWQVRKAQNAELGGYRKDRIGAKGLERQAGGKRRGWRPEKSLAWRDIRFKRRERNWFTEGSVQWEGWYTDAARLSHRLGRVKFLLIR